MSGPFQLRIEFAEAAMRVKLRSPLSSKAIEKAAKNYLALCAVNHREQDVFRASLVQAGENPDPPWP